VKEYAKRERRSKERPIKRMRQLLARLDVLLHESHMLRNSSVLESAAWPAVDGVRDTHERRGT
jgi:hypothetical protein